MIESGIVARYVDANNYLRIRLVGTTTAAPWSLTVTKTIATVDTDIASVSAGSPTGGAWYAVRGIVFSSGAGMAYLLDSNDGIIVSLAFADSALATGGTLATGKPGFFDKNSTATAMTREYDNFSHATPSAEPIAIYSGRAAEIRHDQALRQDSTGTYYGQMPIYRGSRFLIPPAGSAARTSQILVKARRNDVDTAADDQIADSTTATVHYTPRYLVIPR